MDVKRQSLCGSGFSLSAVCMSVDQQHFAKTKMGYISLPSHLNAIIGIKSYHCVILKMVTVHDAINTIQNRVFVIFIKKRTKTCFFSKNNKKTCELFFKTRFFFNPDYLSILFFDFPLIARSGTSYVTISWIGCASHA